jgi:hypothetical protein
VAAERLGTVTGHQMSLFGYWETFNGRAIDECGLFLS